MVSEKEELDCRTCGACCVSPYEQEGWADVTYEDKQRLSPYAQQLLTVCGDAIETKASEFGCACVFLRGTPGKRVSCGIYETRPRVCAGFKVGGTDCKYMREQIFTTRR